MKNIVIAGVAIVGVYLLFAVLSSSSSNTTTADYDNYEDRVYELSDCLDEYKDAVVEYKRAIDDAQSILGSYGDGDDYYDLVSAVEEGYSAVDIGDIEPYCE